MPSVVSLADSRDRRRVIERAILLYKIDQRRYEAARALARLMGETRMVAGAIQWADEAVPDHLYPHVTLGRSPSLIRILAGRDVDRRLWTLGFPEEPSQLNWYLVGQVLGFVMRLAPDAPRSLRPDARPVHWVLEVVGQLVETGWHPNPEVVPIVSWQLEKQAEQLSDEVERRLVNAIAAAVRRGDVASVGSGLEDYAALIDLTGQLEEAASLLRLSYEAAIHLVDGTRGARVARKAGRVLRRAGRFDESFRWYGQAVDLSTFEDDLPNLAHALVGTAFAHIERGATPTARKVLVDALRVASVAGDPDALGAAHLAAGTAARLGGDLAAAAAHSWHSVRAYQEPHLRASSLIALGTALLEAGHLGAAENAYRCATRELPLGSSSWILGCDAYAYVAARRGDSQEYDRRYLRVASRIEEAEPRDRTQLLFFRAKALTALGRHDEAREAHARSIEYARAHGFLQYSERSEIELERIPTPPISDVVTPQIQGWLDTVVALGQLPGSGV